MKLAADTRLKMLENTFPVWYCIYVYYYLLSPKFRKKLESIADCILRFGMKVLWRHCV
jgi:hypothetical protein